MRDTTGTRPPTGICPPGIHPPGTSTLPGAAARLAPASRRVKLVLHRGIVTGTIPGGTRLVQSSIAQELAVSTRPVRDALRELAAEGFVRLDGHGGAVVHELCRSEVEDLFQIRRMLEPLAAARAATHASRAAILQAGELIAAMDTETDGARWAEHNSRFHSLIDEAGSSPRLAAILANLRELSDRYVTHSVVAAPDRTHRGNEEHREILRAIIARDPSAAAGAMLRHLDSRLGELLGVRQIGAPHRGTRLPRRGPRVPRPGHKSGLT
jgi:DNA-binding GntR family transcriptional regulator